jgi:2-polyprenyl-3-methyl-5-hydroxy-6-metoxy-1,4-benzoquinol methylase
MIDRALRWSGNTGKAKIQRDLLAIDRPLSVIDVGAVGPGPLELWRSMPLDELPIDVVAVDSDARAVEQAHGLGLPIDLRVVNGYELSRHFPEASFDIAVCTQVLEHVAEPIRFVAEIGKVLRAGGALWMTVDSGHFAGSHHGDPVWKRLARPWAARASERYYDFGLTEERLRECLDAAGFEVRTLFYCNLAPLKPFSASLGEDDARAFIPAWLDFEVELNSSGFADRSVFRGMYVEARKISTSSSEG